MPRVLLHYWKFLVRYWIFRSTHAEARRARRLKSSLLKLRIAEKFKGEAGSAGVF